MSPGIREAAASALAALAVLVVAVAAVSAGVGYAGDPDVGADPTGDPTTPTGGDVLVPDGLRAVTGTAEDSASYLLPSESAWEIQDDEFSVGFGAADGPEVTMASPSTFRQGFCPDLDFGVPQSFVGFWEPAEADATSAEDSAADSLDDWVAAARVEETGDLLDTTEPSLDPVRLDDGTQAWTAAALVVDEPDPDACDTSTVEIRVVSAVTGDYVANLVMVRGVAEDGSDAADGLDAETAEEILRSLNPR